jgi:hypothetical protein
LGRWDNEGSGAFSGGGRWAGKKRRNYVRIAKYVIFVGFIVVALVVLTVFISRSGLNIEIREQTEGAIQTISVRISNNNFDTLRDATVQFGEQGRLQNIGSMGPFSSAMITPHPQEMDFDKVIVTGNDGNQKVVKLRE